MPVHYRRRAANIARKPGNIADWVRRHGAAYGAMIVLDADSLMSGAAMVRLALALEHNPEVGLIQTLPVIARRRHALRPLAAVRQPAVQPGLGRRHDVVVGRGGDLLGP